jgi:uncharacterized protein YbbC (DUF1343 family)
MALSAEAAGKAGKPFVVLDRPNPIRGDRIEGSVMTPQWKSFVGQFPVALRYGLTPGELMKWLVGTAQVQVDLHVIPMKNYRLSMWWDETGLRWVNPSPNLRDLDATLLFPGIVFFEAPNATEGRGTDAPFKQVGASWLTDAADIAAALNRKRLPGVRFDTITRTVLPGFKFGGETIPMIKIIVTDRDRIRPVDVGAHMLRAIYARHQKDWKWREQWIERLTGSRALRAAVEGNTVDRTLARWKIEADRFAKDVEPYRLYPR